MYNITLSDGTVIKNLKKNGNNFISATEITEADFASKLLHWGEAGPEGHIDHGPSELVQITKETDGWWFIIRELSPQEILNQMFTKNQGNANAAIRSIMNILAKFKIPGGGL